MTRASGVVTFLFTDIEGSTRRWEADADAMRTALGIHDTALRAAVIGHGGEVFKHTGDGICAAFSSPRAAVDAAIAAQRSLKLPVRMGIATGEAENRDGDYFGAVLNRAARVMAAGHGGQILLDGATAGLVTGINLMSLGSRRLRDIARPVEIYGVEAEGLRTEFPPLKTADSTPGNLRPRTTAFIGREAELAELTELVKAHRLVTLTGAGGVGKTRIALEMAVRLADQFPDGVWVIELAAVADPASVPDAVAAVLGVLQQPQLGLVASVAAALETRSRLLIFDNCEHVLDAAADMIEAILAGSDNVKIIATSREGLRVQDEQLWSVTSLDTNGGVESSAVALFLDRAESVARGIALTPDNAVVEICRRLDGIPLAIELAASRLMSMSVNEIRDHLDDRFRLLVGSRRGLERHQTLRHAVQWSYDLLDDNEKSALVRCSVFAGGFDLSAACSVTGAIDEFIALDALDALVRKSLLGVDRSSGRTRYSMLETIRQFAEEQLAASGQAETVRGAHARYFGMREADVMALWDGPRQREAYEWFNAELANLRAAFRWAADNDDLDSAIAIAIYATFLGEWVEQHESVGWAEETVIRAEAVQHPRLAQLLLAASQCYLAGRIEQSVDYGERGLGLATSGRFHPVEWDFETWVMGGVYAVTGQHERWADLCRATIARSSGPHIISVACLAISLYLARDAEGARAAAQGLAAAADHTDNPQMQAQALLAAGVANADSDPNASSILLRRGLVIAQQSGNTTFESHLAVALSRRAMARQEPLDALNCIALAVGHYYDSGSFSLISNPLATLAAVFDQIGDYETAATISGFAETPMTMTLPELRATIPHLRAVLGDEAYESLAQTGRARSSAGMAAYALEQIDSAVAQLSPAGEPK